MPEVVEEYCEHYIHAQLVIYLFPSFIADRTHLPDVFFYVEQQGVTSDWKKLGLYLRILLPELKVIEADYAKADDRMMTMLDHWLKSSTATKQVLIDALRKITKTSTN